MRFEQSIKMIEVMTVATTRPVVLDAARPLREVIRLMVDRNSGYALLTRDDRLAGIFTERDLVARVLGNAEAFDQPATDWMTPNPAKVTQTDSIRKAVRLMRRGGFRNVPIVDNVDRVIGCVRHKDILNYLAEHHSAQVLNLPPDPDQTALEREGG